MAVQTFPFRPAIPSYSLQIVLDGVRWGFDFEFSDARESWYFSLYDAAGTRLLHRQRLTPGADLLRPLVPNGPRGILSCIGEDPYEREELLLFYVPEDDIERVLPTDFQVILESA